ncbi:MAG: hypothetical protein PF961_22930 [Planctomycetota bacterium]|jgi:hypothetical protein|nr:hypothetical protein [Planctomycetota bacterium]
MPTRRDNLLAVLRGEEPDWVPVSINCAQWFDHQQSLGTLPTELEGGDYIDALLRLEFDIFSRNHDGGVRVRSAAPTRDESSETALGTRVTTIRDTPYGELRSVRQEQRAISCWHDEEYPVKDWATHGRAAWWAMEECAADWNEAVFTTVRDRIGEAGIFVVPCACTPLKHLHHLCGLDGACYAIMDHSEDVAAYADAWWRRCVWPSLERLAAHPLVDAVILMDNVDTPFYSPSIATVLWTPYVRAATELMRVAGKTLWVHACGKLDGLCGEFAASGVTGLEGVAHPPLGDLEIATAHAIHPDFVYNGGFGAHEQNGDEDTVRAFYRDFLARAGRRRLIVASACNTAVQTPVERIRLVRDLIRDHCGFPRGS